MLFSLYVQFTGKVIDISSINHLAQVLEGIDYLLSNTDFRPYMRRVDTPECGCEYIICLCRKEQNDGIQVQVA